MDHSIENNSVKKISMFTLFFLNHLEPLESGDVYGPGSLIVTWTSFNVLFFLSQTFNVQFLFLAVKTFRFVFTFFGFKILDSLFNNYVYCLSLFAHGSHSNIRIFSGTRNINLVVLGTG